jgi:hypothetical protein
LQSAEYENKGRPAEKRDLVKAEILRLLESGEPMPSAELESAVCAAVSCHKNLVISTKNEMDVKSYQSNRQWFSVLPRQNTINSEMSQTP